MTLLALEVILARLQELESSPGVKVVQVKKGGLAEKINIVPEDIIIEYAGETGFRVSTFQKLDRGLFADGRSDSEPFT